MKVNSCKLTRHYPGIGSGGVTSAFSANTGA